MKNDGGSLSHMPWFTGDFMRSTRGWSVTARGVYRELLDAQWDMRLLPAEPSALQALIGATDAEWAAGWAKCEPKFPRADSGRQNERLETHRTKTIELSSNRSAAGRAGAAARWQGHGNGNAGATGNRIDNRIDNRTGKRTASANADAMAPSPSPSPSPKPSPPERGELALAPPPNKAEPKEEKALQYPTNLNAPAWENWIGWRRERKHPMSNRALQLHLDLLAKHPPEVQKFIIDQSINANWQGLFAPRGGDAGGANRFEKQGPVTNPRRME